MAIADIRPRSYPAWGAFRDRCAGMNITGITEYDLVDIRKRETLRPLGKLDMVHSTGILYHLPSPVEACWNLRSIVGRYLITNTVIAPQNIETDYGSLRLPDSGVLFCAGLTAQERRILDRHYQTKLRWRGTEGVMPPLDEPNPSSPWIADGELTCWPYWYLYTAHAFRSMLHLCRFRILDEFTWRDHAHCVLCENEAFAGPRRERIRPSASAQALFSRSQESSG